LKEQLTEQAQDEKWMQRALELAHHAAQEGEVPVGAVVVRDDVILGEAWNRPIGNCDPSAHAEINALRRAAKNESNYRLSGATLYVTIEPCTMCVGALVHARISRVVFGAREPKAGAVVSQNNLFAHPSMNTNIVYAEGILADECSKIMSDFFAFRREQKKQIKINARTKN
jgi:tRNA(adenine34) deaminase